MYPVYACIVSALIMLVSGAVPFTFLMASTGSFQETIECFTGFWKIETKGFGVWFALIGIANIIGNYCFWYTLLTAQWVAAAALLFVCLALFAACHELRKVKAERDKVWPLTEEVMDAREHQRVGVISTDGGY